MLGEGFIQCDEDFANEHCDRKCDELQEKIQNLTEEKEEIEQEQKVL